MKPKDRQEKIEAFLATRKPVTKKAFVYEDKARDEDCFEIPVKYLVLNQDNGRFRSYMKTHERLIGPVDASTQEGEDLIIEFLWKTNPDRNKETQANIQRYGQLVPGIISRDGVIIDGNRRCMLLKKIAREENNSSALFKCAVLPDTFDGNPQEIRKLEAWIQLATDPVLDYNPIEKYLTCRELKRDGLSDKEIAKHMKEKSDKEIKSYLGILDLMEQYLKYIDAEGIYQFLTVAKLEGPFFDLYRYLDGRTTPRAGDWEPGKMDFSMLQMSMFDCIRAGCRKELRDIYKNLGVFDHKELWDSFITDYKRIERINKQQEPLASYADNNKEKKSVIDLIQQRDDDWRMKAGTSKEGIIAEMVDDARDGLKTKIKIHKPYRLLKKAHEALMLVKGGTPLSTKKEIAVCQEIKQIAADLLGLEEEK